MEIIWHILLTVCLKGNCLTQDVQWFETQQECNLMLKRYKDIPFDGKWDTIEYVCKPVGSESA